jgi:hypothetical protein
MRVSHLHCCSQALHTAPMPAANELPRPPYYALLDQWLASLGDDADVDDANMPEELTAGGIAVAAYYVDGSSTAWPLSLARLLGSLPSDLDAQLPGEWQLQPLPSLQVGTAMPAHAEQLLRLSRGPPAAGAFDMFCFAILARCTGRKPGYPSFSPSANDKGLSGGTSGAGGRGEGQRRRGVASDAWCLGRGRAASCSVGGSWRAVCWHAACQGSGCHRQAQVSASYSLSTLQHCM